MNHLEQTVYNAMCDDMGEPFTPHDCAQYEVAMAVRDLMNATKVLSELASTKTGAPLVKCDANDIKDAYTRLGRMLSHLRGPYAL